MSDEAFEKWWKEKEDEYGAFYPPHANIARAGWNAALANQRELMACGHPKWALVKTPFITGETEIKQGAYSASLVGCSWCESLRAERQKWQRLYAASLVVAETMKKFSIEQTGGAKEFHDSLAALRERLEKEA